jgi:hypothetical protein
MSSARVTITVLVLATLLIAGKQQPEWQTGKIADASSVSSYIQTSTNRPTTIHDAQVVIIGSEYAYVINDSTSRSPLIGGGQSPVVRAIANRGKGCRYIVGDPIKYWQEKDKLHVRDADGKECKLDIIRQERLSAQLAKPQ